MAQKEWSAFRNVLRDIDIDIESRVWSLSGEWQIPR